VSTITYVTDFARRERLALADLLARLGPDEPTLCDGWTTRDLAAHLVVRDRWLDASMGAMIRPLRDHGERVRLAKAAQPLETILLELRTPPWWSPLSNPLTDELVNTTEFFIHHEDTRRGRPGWLPRALDDDHQRALWRTTRLAGRVALRRLGVPVRVRATGLGSFDVGADPQVTIEGPASELTLFLTGRQRASQVGIDGPAEVAERIRTARLGV